MRPGSCPRQPPSLPVRSRSVRQAIAAALPVVLALILLPPLAFASPPDPSWVAGFYDGADGDDIVSLVYETSAANAAAPPLLAHPLPCMLKIFPEGIVRNVTASRFTHGPRSPPVPWSPEFAHVFISLPPPASGRETPITLPSITTFRRFCCGDLPALRAATGPRRQAQKQFALYVTPTIRGPPGRTPVRRRTSRRVFHVSTFMKGEPT